MRKYKIIQSRENWKHKAKRRGESLRNARRKIKKLKAKISVLENKNMELENISHIPQSQAIDKRGDAYSSEEVKALCVMMVVCATVSFRSVPRLLRIFSSQFLSNTLWIPHFTSVINWTLLFGFGLLKSVGMINEPWIAIMDTSIDVGVKKVLVVLRVRLTALQEKGSAITLHDCECIGVKCRTTFNGEIVKECLSEIFSLTGPPLAVLKDGGCDLRKGLNEYIKEYGGRIFSIDDISHIIANALKADFSKNILFQKLLEVINKARKKLSQTDIYYLKPPQIRTKGRFMSISRVINWCDKIIKLLSHRGQAKKGTLLYRLRKIFPGLTQFKTFIISFKNICEKTDLIMKILKNDGFNRKSYIKVSSIVETFPPRSQIRMRLEKWLRRHIQLHSRMGIGQISLLVSSDIIESLLGKFKIVVSRNPNPDFNRLVLTIPTLCGEYTEKYIMNVLQNVSHQEMKNWVDQKIPFSYRKKRHEILTNCCPKTGKAA